MIKDIPIVFCLIELEKKNVIYYGFKVIGHFNDTENYTISTVTTHNVHAYGK